MQRQARRLENGEDARLQILGDLDDGLDHRLVGAGTRNVRRRAPTTQQIDRLDDEGLARAGLAGEDIHPCAELDLDIRQDREIRHSQMPQHHAPSFRVTGLGPGNDSVTGLRPDRAPQ